MLEQFRIFQTALRLGQFTTKQLAEASGVVEGTVQKTVRRHKELFLSTEDKSTERRGRRRRRHSVRPELLRAAAQKEADRPVLPPLPMAAGGASLGRLLTQETLFAVLPYAKADERPALVAAAANHLDVADGSDDARAIAELRDLLRSVRILVEAQVDLVTLAGEEDSNASLNVALNAIEALLSFNERKKRDEDCNRRRQTELVLAALPSKLAALSLSAAGRFNHRPSWWLEVLSAAWLLLSHDRWKEITGDVSGAELARTIASLQHPHPETVGQPLFAPAQCA